jgi:chemotaxis protein methyltransferase CheR
MQHRVANGLQIIASILLLKARTVQYEKTRLHLQDAHQRVMSVATVQQQLQASGLNESIEIGPYLLKLCDSLAKSMIGDRRPLSISVQATAGAAVSDEAVSLGLIVTELVINALKQMRQRRCRTARSNIPTRRCRGSRSAFRPPAISSGAPSLKSG